MEVTQTSYFGSEGTHSVYSVSYVKEEFTFCGTFQLAGERYRIKTKRWPILHLLKKSHWYSRLSSEMNSSSAVVKKTCRYEIHVLLVLRILQKRHLAYLLLLSSNCTFSGTKYSHFHYFYIKRYCWSKKKQFPSKFVLLGFSQLTTFKLSTLFKKDRTISQTESISSHW